MILSAKFNFKIRKKTMLINFISNYNQVQNNNLQNKSNIPTFKGSLIFDASRANVQNLKEAKKIIDEFIKKNPDCINNNIYNPESKKFIILFYNKFLDQMHNLADIIFEETEIYPAISKRTKYNDLPQSKLGKKFAKEGYQLTKHEELLMDYLYSKLNESNTISASLKEINKYINSHPDKYKHIQNLEKMGLLKIVSSKKCNNAYSFTDKFFEIINETSKINTQNDKLLEELSSLKIPNTEISKDQLEQIESILNNLQTKKNNPNKIYRFDDNNNIIIAFDDSEVPYLMTLFNTIKELGISTELTISSIYKKGTRIIPPGIKVTINNKKQTLDPNFVLKQDLSMDAQIILELLLNNQTRKYDKKDIISSTDILKSRIKDALDELIEKKLINISEKKFKPYSYKEF